ncbi:MAG TPA: SGNH/GDSL hydrolase family protein [bacterium]|nr:SGNH/GDSL hydrolase family protein [bacterium]HPN42818.1 SGNH/GDSL hydrolase family protein [bacterium]
MERRQFLKYALTGTLSLPAFTILGQCGSNKAVQKQSALVNKQRVLFLGDSITQDGTYINYIETFLTVKYPEKNLEIIDLGLSSETVCGLTEPKHPYPRPNVNDRLPRILERVNADIVVACYGMNDGIYAPLDQNRFKAYQDGILKMVNAIKETGATLYLLTPPPHDAQPVKPKVVPETHSPFTFDTPFEKYDAVLKEYGDWIKSLQIPGVIPVDIHQPMNDFLFAQRTVTPDFFLARDGVHPGPLGHWIMAITLLNAWGESPMATIAEIDARKKRARQGNIKNLVVKDEALSFSWPVHLAFQFNSTLPDGMRNLETKLLKHLLYIKNYPFPRANLVEGETVIATLSSQQLADGVDLSAFPALSLNKRSVKLLNMIGQKRRIYDYSLLFDIGHTLPTGMTPMPLDKATLRADELKLQIKELAFPLPVEMRLVPVVSE